MDEFFEILRDELDKILSGSGVIWQKKDGMMQCFDKAFARAVIKYAAKKGITLE